MAKDDRLYSIKEFSTMAALTPSAVRFYQKNGVIKPEQQPNGYFMYTKHDAFRINSFKMLLSYGFSIQEAVNLLDTNYSSPSFFDKLSEKEQELEQEQIRIRYRLNMLRHARTMLKGEYKTFEVSEFPTSYIAQVSDEDNFLIAKGCKEEVALMAESLGLTHYVRILYSADLEKDDLYWKPSYGMCVLEKNMNLLFACTKKNLLKIEGGRVLKYIRRSNRKNSEMRSSYNDLFDYMKQNNLTFRGEVLLFPHFFNLDSEANDFETIIVFLK